MAEEARTAVVVGVGEGNGMALARRFAQGGYRVALIARSADALSGFAAEIPGAVPYPLDVGDQEAAKAVYGQIVREMGPVDALLYNAGSGVWGSVLEVDPAKFESSWRVNTFGALLAAKALVPGMLERGSGRIGFIGASAAWRGRPKTLAFASAKAAQRSLAQSLARELGPKGIHVCYAVLDGVVDLPRTRSAMSDKPEDFFMKPDDIAQAVFDVLHQPRSAWTFELDLRPHIESW